MPLDRKAQQNKDSHNKQLRIAERTNKVINLDYPQDIHHHHNHHKDEIKVRPNASADVFLADLIKKKESRNYRLKLDKVNCKQFEDSMIYNANEQQKASKERNNNNKDTTRYQLNQKQFLSTLKDKESYQLFLETDLSPRVTDFVRKNASGKTNHTLKRQFHSFNANSQQGQHSIKKTFTPSEFLQENSIPRTLSPPPFSIKEKPRLKQISAQLPNKINSPSLHVRSVDSSVINNLDISPIQAFILKKNQVKQSIITLLKQSHQWSLFRCSNYVLLFGFPSFALSQKRSKTNEKIPSNHEQDYNILRENFNALRQDIETSISSDMKASSLIQNINNLNVSNEFKINQGKHLKTSNSLEQKHNDSGKNITHTKDHFRRIKTLGTERSISKQRNRQKEDISAWQEGQESLFEAADPFLDIDFKTILPSIEKKERYSSTKVQKFLKEQGHTKIRECLSIIYDKRTHAKQAEQFFPLLE